MIDYAALLGATAGIQVCKADYDRTRDGGAIGPIPINTQIIPEASVILGWAFHTTASITANTTGYIDVLIGDYDIGSPPPTGNHTTVAWQSAAFLAPLPRATPISALVGDDVITAGAFNVWIFYLPT